MRRAVEAVQQKRLGYLAAPESSSHHSPQIPSVNINQIKKTPLGRNSRTRARACGVFTKYGSKTIRFNEKRCAFWHINWQSATIYPTHFPCFMKVLMGVIHMPKTRNFFVTIISIPPHTSSNMQPLDGITYLRATTLFDIAELFGRAYLRTQWGGRALKGFRTTGIFPINRNVFTEEDFLAAEHTEEQTYDYQQEQDDQGVQQGIQQHQRGTARPQDIVRVPALKKRRETRGRAPGKARIITPNKEEFEETIRKREEKDKNIEGRKNKR
ncbi:hypothetical protein JTB14_009623 [Gonioctena quinquepunctata]|nr:hypothetical protein JTB14_009623 [Gonioctena quinquepunctata]